MMCSVVPMVAPRSAVVSSISLLVLYTVGRGIISSSACYCYCYDLAFSMLLPISHRRTFHRGYGHTTITPRHLFHDLDIMLYFSSISLSLSVVSFPPPASLISFLSPHRSSHLSLHMTSYVPPLLLPILLSTHILPYLTSVG